MARDSHSETGVRKKFTPQEALVKIQRYCAYQERCHQEVKARLYDFGLSTSQVDTLVSQLITEGFLNEERFAKAYAGGKFRMKKWGRLKIQRELELLGLTRNCIQRGLKEIEAGDYSKTIKTLVRKKSISLQEPNLYRKRDKVTRYVIGKGFEPELVWEIVRDLLPD